MVFDDFFGPLDTIYCIYFNVLSIYGILGCIGLLIFGFIYPIIKNKIFFILYVILFFIIYFQNRLLYNMCINNKNIEYYEPIPQFQNDCRRPGKQILVPGTCPVCGETPFCTSTGAWMCKTMWTPQNNIYIREGQDCV